LNPTVRGGAASGAVRTAAGLSNAGNGRTLRDSANFRRIREASFRHHLTAEELDAKIRATGEFIQVYAINPARNFPRRRRNISRPKKLPLPEIGLFLRASPGASFVINGGRIC